VTFGLKNQSLTTGVKELFKKVAEKMESVDESPHPVYYLVVSAATGDERL
jgi:hypothetical protein